MLPEDIYFRTLSAEELWKRYCGFLDLTAEEFLSIQGSLLTEQLQLAAGGILGRKILGERPPRTLEEFQATIPFTTYDDYEPYLSEKREEALAVKPLSWSHSAGRGGKFKWIPHSEAGMDKVARNCIALFVLSSTSRKGQINIRPGLKFLTIVPPAPYTSGTGFGRLRERFTIKSIPTQASVTGLPFREQVARGFEVALRDGFEVAGAIASVLVRMGQQMSGQAASSSKLSAKFLHPKVLFRLLRGLIRSRSQHRPVYPKDLWNPKGIIAAGLDMSIYKDEIEKYWGVQPFDVYASTETMLLAMQSWNKRNLTFLPDAAFLEFLPYSPFQTSAPDHRATLLIDKLEKDRYYEVIITQFHGMPLMRYRLGDVIRVVSRGDEDAGVKLPQFEIVRKIDEAINLAALCSLDERTIWKAIADTGVKYADWTAYKEYDQSETYLRLLIELKEERAAAEMSALLDRSLRKVDTDYGDIDHYLQTNPIRTTLLSEGTFARFTEAKVRAGADLAHIKPKHIEPSREVLEQLFSSGGVKEKQ
ncbi:MAG: hypothetical protein A2V99_10235 [Spirochaetes bacterium RBG_16_67_19]|nr:MAG: hypothetical protein A2V99_10235 [Spirochaetes bacterium RBG_16_67_19]